MSLDFIDENPLTILKHSIKSQSIKHSIKSQISRLCSRDFKLRLVIDELNTINFESG